jgi:hypothetical protein
MVSDRPYRKAMTYGMAMSTLRDGRGTQWDADVVDILVSVAASHRNRAIDADLALAPAVGEEFAVPTESRSLAG